MEEMSFQELAKENAIVTEEKGKKKYLMKEIKR